MMKTYRLDVSSDNFKTQYIIKAKSLKEASLKAKSKFVNEYHEFNIKVGVSPTDLHNHIHEILDIIYKGENYNENNYSRI